MQFRQNKKQSLSDLRVKTTNEHIISITSVKILIIKAAVRLQCNHLFSQRAPLFISPLKNTWYLAQFHNADHTYRLNWMSGRAMARQSLHIR